MSFTFAPLRTADLGMLHEWLQRPHVREWWDSPSTWEEVVEDYGPVAEGTDTTRAFIAHRGGEPVGFIQVYVVMGSGDGWWPDETDPAARGIDQFLAVEGQLGQGIGRAMIRAFLGEVFTDPGVTTVQTDPSPDNERAIRCYRGAGFADRAVVETPDGPAHLMVCPRARFLETGSVVAVRAATVSDIEWLAIWGSRLGRMHQGFDAHRFVVPEPAEDAHRPYYAEHLADERARVLVATVDGVPAGYAFVRWEPGSLLELRADGAWLHEIYIEEEARKGTVSRALMDAADAAARALGSDHLLLSVSPSNIRAQRFFSALGYRQTLLEMRRELP